MKYSSPHAWVRICALFLLACFLSVGAASAAGIRSINETPLTRGWDNFNLPLRSGKVVWEIRNGDQLHVAFHLQGAKPNHTYTVGMHFMDKKCFRVDDFLGESLDKNCSQISREGNSAYVIAYDFGKLHTDGSGNGNAEFSGTIPQGRYEFQYTVRIGECQPAKGITAGCACVYRTGLKFAHLKEIIDTGDARNLPMNEARLTRGWDIFNAPLKSGRVDWNVTQNKYFHVKFVIDGAKPNHSYTVGAHLMGSKRFTVTEFPGYRIGEASSPVSREGKTAEVLAFDFGKLTTDSTGYGQAQFDGAIENGEHKLQFTVRIGDCDPPKGITSGCACVYRTGNRFAEQFAIVSTE